MLDDRGEGALGAAGVDPFTVGSGSAESAPQATSGPLEQQGQDHTDGTKTDH